MSVLSKFFEGFGFRSVHPVFEPGDEISAYMTGYDEEAKVGIVRVGDTIIEVPEATPELVDRELRLQIVDFDEQTHRGRAEQVTAPGSEQDGPDVNQ